MRWKYILSIIGILIIFLGLTMVFPLVVGLLYKDTSVIPFFKSIAITVSFGLALYLIFRGQNVENITQREGMAIVALCWTGIGLFGSLPFYLKAESSTVLSMRFLSLSPDLPPRSLHFKSHRRGFQRAFILAQPDPVAGGHGNYCALRGHPAVFGCGGHAALQSRSPKPGAG